VTLDGWWIESWNGRANHGMCGSVCEHILTGLSPGPNEPDFGHARLRYLEALDAAPAPPLAQTSPV
jgi:hypothetical protein